MDTAVIDIKIDARLKRQAASVADELGLSLSAVIKGFLKHFVKVKTITFGVRREQTREEPTEYLIKALKESKEDIKAGRVVSFTTPGDELKFLDTMIANERKRGLSHR